jgi:hypothetical protein
MKLRGSYSNLKWLRALVAASLNVEKKKNKKNKKKLLKNYMQQTPLVFPKTRKPIVIP